jgi:hypothetical protein
VRFAFIKTEEGGRSANCNGGPTLSSVEGLAFGVLRLVDGEPNLLERLFLLAISFGCSLLSFAVVLIFLIARDAWASPRIHRFAIAMSIAGLVSVGCLAQLFELGDFFFDFDADSSKLFVPVVLVAIAILFFAWCIRVFSRRLAKSVG